MTASHATVNIINSISSATAARCKTATAAAVLVVGGLCLGAGCSTNPATGRLQWDTMSTDQEIAIGEEAKGELTTEYGGAIEDPALRDYVDQTGRRMTPHTEAFNPDLPWEFTLLDSEVINAFALPGGKVFLSRGLMSQMTNEAQVAGVVGHEIGHVTAQHTDDRISQAMIVAGLASASGAVAKQSDSDWSQVVPLVVGLGGQGYLLSYGRSQELEADKLGMRYMARAGYDPYGQLQVMQILEESRREAGGGAAPPEWLSTHPYPETRIANIRELLASEFRDTQNNPEYDLHERRFLDVARPRLDRLAQRARERGELPRSTFDPLIAALLFDPASPRTWCAHCRGEIEPHTASN